MRRLCLHSSEKWRNPSAVTARGRSPPSLTDQLGPKVSRDACVMEAFGFTGFHRPALTQDHGVRPKIGGVIPKQPATTVCSCQQRLCQHAPALMSKTDRKSSFFLPLRRCFFLVLRHIPLTPRTGFMSLLLMGGGCSMGLGARVKHTGKPAAHIRIPVIPDACIQRTHIDTQE